MNVTAIHLLACPNCQSDLVQNPTELVCRSCTRSFPVVGDIPRFVSADNYAQSFGFQWNQFSRTQLDENWGIAASRDRFVNETKWPSDLRGQTVLEAGCGAGRFTAHAANTGATLVSFDYSTAVEAAHRNHGHLGNVLFLQADIHALPLKTQAFDKIYCFGVLQHCPDPARAFNSLLPFLKPGGEIAVDVYRLSWRSLFMGKYYLRPLTRRMPPERLLPRVKRYVDVVFPALTLPHKIVGSRAARMLGQVMGVCDYRGYFPLSEAHHRELALLDTFDMLSPAHDHPKSVATIRRWFEAAGFEAIDVKPGYNGVEARGRKPLGPGRTSHPPHA